MKIIIAAIGRLKDSGELALAARYIERTNTYARSLAVGPVRVVEMPESRAASADARRDDEAARLVKAVSEADAIVVLDENGKSLTSEAFASWVGRQRDGGISTLAFVIGGPDGHGPLVLSKAHLKLALGTMTLPHGLARVVLAEQIYRAATILAGHPYHRA